jgi:isoleucyl-tRNA synthetase
LSGQSPYTPLPARVQLPAVDHEVLAFWREQDIFDRSVDRTAGGPEWVFFEGPPTANGKPGTHHVEARVFKDIFPRFKTMKGFHVARRAGWDCHGLPVEIAVEKELGLSGKQDIEQVGIEEFNARCRESVQRYIGEFEQMTERVGYWVDMAHPHWTMTPEYVDSVWWALKQLNDKGLLAQDHRVAPYCPRCGTGLSDQEVAQGFASSLLIFSAAGTPSLAPRSVCPAAADGTRHRLWRRRTFHAAKAAVPMPATSPRPALIR